MHVAEQFEFALKERSDFERQLEERWEANERADRVKNSIEARACGWAFGFRDAEFIRSLPSYELTRVVNLYEWELAIAERFGYRRIRSYASLEAETLERMDWVDRIARDMAEQLSADWSVNRPPTVFTNDPAVADAVSLMIGRRIEAIPRKNWIEV